MSFRCPCHLGDMGMKIRKSHPPICSLPTAAEFMWFFFTTIHPTTPHLPLFPFFFTSLEVLQSLKVFQVTVDLPFTLTLM